MRVITIYNGISIVGLAIKYSYGDKNVIDGNPLEAKTEKDLAKTIHSQEDHSSLTLLLSLIPLMASEPIIITAHQRKIHETKGA